MTQARTLSAVALLVAAVGIVVQILGGADYPVVPPGMLILVVAAGIVGFMSGRWAPVAAILAAVFLIIGLVAADQATRLVEIDTVLDTTGLWIQMISVVVALASAVVAIARPQPVRGE